MNKSTLVEFTDSVQCSRCRMVQPIVTQIDMAVPYAEYGVDLPKFIRDERAASKRIAAQHHAKQCIAEAEKRGPVVISG